MPDRLAIVLQTCDRLADTARTLESLGRHHPTLDGIGLYHVDDASADRAGLARLVAGAGFETVARSESRRGAYATRRTGIVEAAARGADAILWLENDWTLLRPVPWSTWAALPAEVYTLRLYGAYKGPDRTAPCLTVDLARDRAPVTWTPAAGLPGVELARIHWGAPPAITRTAALLSLHAAEAAPGYDRRPEPFAASRGLGLVARLVDNVVVHHGTTTTARPGAAPRPVRYTAAWQRARAGYTPGAVACLEATFAAVGRPASLLDVGCGLGALVDLAAAAGVDAVGVDLSLDGSAGRLRHADLEAPLDLGRRFDLVLCWEVAEHLTPAAAPVLVASLVRHLAPGGLLLFTAAAPGQGGDGHLHEQPAAWWADRFEAAGLTPDPAAIGLAARWRAVAPSTPWYGRNLRGFRALGAGARFEAEPLPTLAVTMRTADRTPGPNYLAGTLAALYADGDARLILAATDPADGFVEAAVAEAGVLGVRVDRPDVRRTPNLNGLAQVRAGLARDVHADWILLLEDDLEFCRAFLRSVRRWLAAVARPDRHLYRLFGFRVAPPVGAGLAYDDLSLGHFAGSQAVILRRVDAVAFLAWTDAHLARWAGWRGNGDIAFDKLLAAWHVATWPGTPAVMSSPMLVRHVGQHSSIHRRTAHMDPYYAGAGYQVPALEVTR